MHELTASPKSSRQNRESMANIFSRSTSADVVNGNRFGQNGTNGSSPPSLNGNGEAPVPATLAGRLGHYWQTYAPFRNPFKKSSDGIDDGEVESGVHAITKKTDFWFNRELYQLEQEAKALATQWAEKGLPRHDVVRVGVLEPEQVLGMKSLELFRQWHRRVRVKMQDQIQASTAKLNQLIGESRAEINALETTALERKNNNERIDALQAFKEPDPAKIGYDRIFKSSVGFW